jgi:rhomboid protease GluP
LAWGSVVVLGFLRWWLFLGKYPIVEMDEDIWQYWIPAFFPAVPVLVWLKPRFNRLYVGKNGKRRNELPEAIAWLTIALMLIFSQHYLTTSTGTLLEVENVKAIRKQERARYYRIKSFAVHRPIGGVFYAFRKSGKFNARLDMHIYFAHPILTYKRQPITMTPLYWYGVKFHKQISNLGSNATKQQKFEKFFHECVAKMQNYDFYHIDHFEHTPASFDRENFRRAVGNALQKRINNDFMILQPVLKSAESRNANMFALITGTFLIGLAGLALTLKSRRR